MLPHPQGCHTADSQQIFLTYICLLTPSLEEVHFYPQVKSYNVDSVEALKTFPISQFYWLYNRDFFAEILLYLEFVFDFFDKYVFLPIKDSYHTHLSYRWKGSNVVYFLYKYLVNVNTPTRKVWEIIVIFWACGSYVSQDRLAVVMAADEGLIGGWHVLGRSPGGEAGTRWSSLWGKTWQRQQGDWHSRQEAWFKKQEPKGELMLLEQERGLFPRIWVFFWFSRLPKWIVTPN